MVVEVLGLDLLAGRERPLTSGDANPAGCDRMPHEMHGNESHRRLC